MLLFYRKLCSIENIMNPTQELYDLCQHKLYVLQRALISEADPLRKFKLQEAIKETKAQCDKFVSILGENLLADTGKALTVHIKDSHQSTVIAGNGNTLSHQS